jgi:nucleoside-diphosphate-sugar epimerase
LVAGADGRECQREGSGANQGRIVKIFVTGVDGYIGSLLAPLLLASGHDLVGFDTGFYRRGWWYAPEAGKLAPVTVSRDLRQVEASDLAGCEAVVHLAELSNDPLGELSPEVTTSINHAGSVRLAMLAKSVGVSRFVYSSSCSVYGAGALDWLDERAETRPQTTYARCKVMVERDVAALADGSFSPVFLRNATAFGASPRMRFDLVLNNLAGLASVTGRIAMTSDGTPWRPLVHVLDICRAMIAALEAPLSAVHAQVFNVGSNDQNYQVRHIAAVVGEAFPQCQITTGSQTSDARSYRVSFDKIHAALPGFKCEWDARKGVTQLHRLFERVGFDRDQFGFAAFTRLEELKYLLQTRQLDRELFWTH